MLIKSASDRTRDLSVLAQLLEHPLASAEARTRIEKEIRTIRAGAKGEAEAAYEIDFHFGHSRYWAVIHDLRIEWQGKVAQIDHLLIGRAMECWVCESKHFADGVSINEEGEFTAFYDRRPYGVPSPIEQNRKHALLLQQVLSSSLVRLPTRLGIALRPSIESVVLVSKGARITRPKRNIEGLDRVIKCDQLRTLMNREIDGESTVSTLVSMTKIVGTETLEEFARQIAALHRPIEFDWHGKFGLSSTAPAVSTAVTTNASARTPLSSETTSRRHGPKHAAATIPTVEGTAAEEPSEDVHEGRISTSRLAAAWGLRSAGEAVDRLVAAGLLEVDGERQRLTERGLRAGGRLVEKSRYGPYFLWPKDLKL